MRRNYLLLAVMLPVIQHPAWSCQARPTTGATAVLDFHAPPADPYADAIRNDASAAVLQVQSFFGAPFPDPVHFYMVDKRADFDAAVKKFGVSPTECWMVGLGTADAMVVLSPTAWKKQACEHDPGDSQAIQQLITHELIHVSRAVQFQPGLFRT